MTRLFRPLVIVFLLIAPQTPLSAADESPTGRWISISESVTDAIVAAGGKIGWPGLTGGVAVDRTNGDVFMVICDQGLWKSSDQGAHFMRVDGGAVGGRCETGFTLNVDPAGKRLATFMVYGGCAATGDSGATWTRWKSNHFDCGAVDWEDTGKTLLTIRHESGGMLTCSTDAGQTWTDLGKGFKNGVGLFDSHTLIATKGQGILRSDDGGKNWTQVSDASVSGATMYVVKGVGYWTTDKGLLVSRDKGISWAVQGSPIKALQGPYFSDDERHLIVVTRDGLMETRDGGESWKLAAPLPPGFAFAMVGPTSAGIPSEDLIRCIALHAKRSSCNETVRNCHKSLLGKGKLNVHVFMAIPLLSGGSSHGYSPPRSALKNERKTELPNSGFSLSCLSSGLCVARLLRARRMAWAAW